MRRSQYKNITNNIQANMSPLKASNPTMVGSKKCNTAEAQDTDYKIALNEHVRGPYRGHESLKEIYENISNSKKK